MQIGNLLQILDDLLAFRTVSSESNLECIDYIKGILEGYGARCVVQPDETGGKANLLASIGPNVPGGVVLSGHTDVVPVEGQTWSFDPWKLTQIDGRLYGRGTTDMKGFVAQMIVAAGLAKNRALLRPLHLAFSYDEELGCLGAWPMATLMKETLPDNAAVIVGEPTENRIVTSHKGIVTFVTDIKGHSVHSSRVHEGVSAVTESARLITWLDELMYKEAETRKSNCFDPPFTTIHCGVVSGGIAANVVAPSSSFITDVRTIEGISPADYQMLFEKYVSEVVLPRLRNRCPDVDIRITRRSLTPGLDPDPGNLAEVITRRITGDNGTSAVSYATEAGVYQRAGFPVVVCGPGSIEQAHQADEYIRLDELDRGLRLMERLVDDLAA
ncbi:acetylornithine deacetylase [Rhizobium sp. PRIMUS64]|uniref:acetylornithine deacetylase n=1 Tax=Rhizobium sp. PRIMUS64 TaxID=2908925 RepID=UPI001FF23879|nr:acetylornithine deacetylase [Rhizobium sp. PRIMUS64]MCJ9690551.1 acetylornithine deacetylase [Rhizobium sp. PRIMUS64]